MPDRPRNLVLGTAGHIDHGKTALVRALTGVDTDRLPAEKQRGITIDLGFAALDLGDIPARPGRRARPRAVHPQHAGRRLGARPGHAGRRGRRLGDAADPRAPGDPPPARPLGRRGRPDQVRPGRAVLARPGGGRRPRAGPRHVPRRCGDRPDLGGDRRGHRRAQAASRPPAWPAAGTIPACSGWRSTARSPWPVTDGRDRDGRLGQRRRRRRAGVAARRPDGPGPRPAPARPAGRADRPRLPGRDQPGGRPPRRDPPRPRAGGAGVPGGDPRLASSWSPRATPAVPLRHRERYKLHIGTAEVSAVLSLLERPKSARGTASARSALAGRAGRGRARPAVRAARREPPATLGGGRVIGPSPTARPQRSHRDRPAGPAALDRATSDAARRPAFLGPARGPSAGSAAHRPAPVGGRIGARGSRCLGRPGRAAAGPAADGPRPRRVGRRARGSRPARPGPAPRGPSPPVGDPPRQTRGRAARPGKQDASWRPCSTG